MSTDTPKAFALSSAVAFAAVRQGMTADDVVAAASKFAAFLEGAAAVATPAKPAKATPQKETTDAKPAAQKPEPEQPSGTDADAASVEPVSEQPAPKPAAAKPAAAKPAVAAAKPAPAKVAEVPAAKEVQAEAAPELKKEDVQKLIVKMVTTIGQEQAIGLLNKYGSPNVTKLDPSKYAAVAAEAKAALAAHAEAAVEQNPAE